MSDDALRRLSNWIDAATHTDFSGKSGKSGNVPEKSELFSYHRNFPGGKSGKSDTERLTTLTTCENAVVRKETRSFNDLTTLTTLTTKNDDDLSAASVAAVLAWLSPGAHTAFIASPDGTVEVRHRQPDGHWSPPLIERFEPRRAAKGKPSSCSEPEPRAEWGLSRYMIRDLARWYIEEADRRRDGDVTLDQRALDRDLRKLVAERGAFPEFIAVEFERVMRIVFAPIGSR